MDPLSDIIDQFIDTLLYRPDRTARLGWRDKYPTLKQRRVLVDNGYRVPPTRGAAFDLIGTFQTWEER